jgi:23S rRNA (adenine2503-C2)-methyltransferase
VDLASLTVPELSEVFTGMGEKPFRARQVFGWVHAKRAGSFDEMTDLPKALREKLKTQYSLSTSLKIIKTLTSADSTTKYLFQTENNSIIESVYMDYSFGASVCVSTQAGCRMGCAFCASGRNGLERSLSAGEICGQVYEICRDRGVRASHVVMMGSGEPLDNYEQSLRFIRLITSPDGLGLSQRHITLSTCGLTPRICDLAKENLPITLAVSLHAPNDRIRGIIMPVARAYPMDEMLAACRGYAEKTGRRVTFEYAMISGLNDGPEAAAELSAKLKHGLFHVNLIPINSVKGSQFKPSQPFVVKKFEERLRRNGLEVTVRRKLGSDISAACGQLRAGYTGTD